MKQYIYILCLNELFRGKKNKAELIYSIDYDVISTRQTILDCHFTTN